MYKPWIGRNYKETCLLVLGESTYSWRDEEQKLQHPSLEHSIETVEWAISDFDKSPRFIKTLSRGLAGKENPSPQESAAAWDKIAFTNFVVGTVGEGARTRPVGPMWEKARESFKRKLSFYFVSDPLPSRILVLGKGAWSSMPECDDYVTDDFQLYRLGEAKIDCFALRHPAAGLAWKDLESSLRYISPAIFTK